MATHGSFVLYDGGLGWRYGSDSPARGGDPDKGSASDSYLSTTLIGGRTPLHDFDPERINFRCVNTWWLVGDIARALALSAFESFDFAGYIHRQHAVFAGGEGGGGQVWVNRPGTPALPGGAQNSAEVPCGGGNAAGKTWLLPNGLSLPPDGFYAETPGARAGIVSLAGRRCAFSEGENGVLFVDGRPDRHDGTGPADTANAAALADFAACGLAIKTDGAFRLERDGDGALILTPIPDGTPFRAEIDLAGFAPGAPAPGVLAVEPVEPAPGASPPEWHLEGTVLSLSLDSQAFAYRVVF